MAVNVAITQPLHTRLNDLPAALIPASLALDVLALATGRRSFADASRYALVGAALGGAAAGVAGLADYRSLPPAGEAHRLGRLHGLLNAGLLGLTLANLSLRGDRSRPGVIVLAMGLIGNVGLLISGSLGLQMVYGEGVGVARTPTRAGSSRRTTRTRERAPEPIRVGTEMPAI